MSSNTSEGSCGGGGGDTTSNNNDNNLTAITAQGGPPLSSSHLPPPPTAASSNVNGTANNNLQQQHPLSSSSGFSSLPPPPKISIPTHSNSANATSAESKSNINSSSSLPPPPTLSFTPPPSKNISSNNSGSGGGNNNDGPTPRTAALLSEMNDQQQQQQQHETTNSNSITRTHSIHSTKEQIPPLSSAPNSGISIDSALNDALSAATYMANTIGQSAQEVVFPHTTYMPNPPNMAVGGVALDTPTFSSSKGGGGGNSGNNGGGGGQKDNFAMLFSTAQTNNPQHQHQQQSTATAATTTMTSSPELPINSKESVTMDAKMMETPDNSSHPLVTVASIADLPPPLVGETIQQQQQQQVVAPTAGSSSSSSSNGLPPRSPMKPSTRGQPPLPPPANKQQQHQQQIEQHQIQQQHQQQRPNKPKQRANAHPPLTVLATRQTRLSVLILPTSDAQSIAQKNNTSLTELFRVFGNTKSGSSGSSSSVRDNELEPPLPPFRSANRSMTLSWDQIVLDFVSIQDMEASIPEVVSERALGESACVWDEDVLIKNKSGGGSVSGEEEDEELKQLEKCVADALAEEEEEERIRKEDGIPSMTSAPPSSRRISSSDNNDDSNNDEFPIQHEEILKECADAAISLTSRPNTPWLSRFRHTLDCSTDGIGHEMFRNPSVVILAASTSESYINCFAELANVHHLPRPYHDGRYDPNGVRREFLLLHDVYNGPKDFDEARALQRMRDRFGPGCCQVLRVNSLSPEKPVVVSDGYNSSIETDEWENAGPSTPFVANELSKEYGPSLTYAENSPIRGACLSPIDKRAIRRYVANMVATGLIPSVERRIANLNTTVTNAKKGVKNVIKSFWRKPKESVSSALSDGSGNRSDTGNPSKKLASSETARYRFDSIESQTRLLADTLFLMRDYDAALGIYRLVKDDYKHDKAHLYYASVQEMIVLCMFMIDPSKYSYDVQHSIETALYSYSRAADEEKDDVNPGVRPSKAPYATRLATRLCLALSSARTLCDGKQMEIADLLASASSHETPLGAAVLLERSSSHYYQAGMIRKYAFHMLMAGHMFRSAGQERHAFRCFAASLYVYHGERWGELRSHLHSALAAQLFGMSRFALAMQFYAKLIGSAGGGRVSVRSQQKFLNHLVEICRDNKAEALIAVDRMGYSPSDVQGMMSELNNDLQQIEISNVGFPDVDDSSVRIYADNSDNASVLLGRADSIAANATSVSGTGDESVWQDMIICAESELRASSVSSSITNVTNDDESKNPIQVGSGNETIDRIIAEIDKEEREAEYRERQKRKGNARTVEVRATSEPIVVSFTVTNPLGLDIELTEMQLVASLSCPESGLLQSNEVSSLCGKSDRSSSKGWKFHGSEIEYESPDFMYQKSIDSANSESAVPVDNGSDPYFVVTKSTIAMTPSSSTISSLKICPLTKGDFKIIGVRFKLLGEVWIYHRFDLPGPLLQDTQLNRSKRVRGESLLLKSKIEEEMPSLKVTITPSNENQSTVLQGQTSSWTLKLSNFGYAPATNIMLKTNAPWLNIKDEMGQEINEECSTSHCVGPSGTLMKVPFKVSGDDDILQPGETIEVPVFIRTSGGGRQDFYMLCRYELWKKDKGANDTSPRHRWARKLLSVPVYPSITMSASLMPSYSNKGEHILSVEVRLCSAII